MFWYNGAASLVVGGWSKTHNKIQQKNIHNHILFICYTNSEVLIIFPEQFDIHSWIIEVSTFYRRKKLRSLSYLFYENGRNDSTNYFNDFQFTRWITDILCRCWCNMIHLNFCIIYFDEIFCFLHNCWKKCQQNRIRLDLKNSKNYII